MKQKLILIIFFLVGFIGYAQKIYHTTYIIKNNTKYDTLYLKIFHKKKNMNVHVISFRDSTVCIQDYSNSRQKRKLIRKKERVSCGQDLLYDICGNFLFNKTKNTLVLDVHQEATGLKIKKVYQIQTVKKGEYILTNL